MSHTPHDALFYDTFSNPKHAAGELRTVLPPALVAGIDFATLAAEPGRFVDAKLSSRYWDVLFSVQIAGRTGFIYLLFEHFSKAERMTMLRLLEYMVGSCSWALGDGDADGNGNGNGHGNWGVFQEVTE